MENSVSTVKKAWMVGGMVILAVVLAMAMWGYLTAPAHLMTVDVNPSISIETNRLGEVVSVTGINEDAQTLLAGYDPTGRELERVVEDLAALLLQNGYLKNGTDNVLVTVRGDEAAADNLALLNKGIVSYLEKKGIETNMISRIEQFTEADVAKAEKLGVSVGKLLVLEHLAGGDEALLVELAGLSMTELAKFAATKGIDFAELDGKSLDDPLTKADMEELFDADFNVEALEAAEAEEERLEEEREAAEEEAEKAEEAAEEAREKQEQAA
ncbi:MAG: hypothetical protein RSG96_03140, partial [Clostridia bacterium]